MRKITPVLTICVLFLNLGTSLAHADGMILPEALSPDYLVVRNHHVTVTIEDGHAVTRVAQEFYNPQTFPVTGRYLFPVPPDAILSRFQAIVDGLPQAFIRQQPETTNAELYAAIVERRDPSLLQYADWETIALDISLQPGASKQMNLEYEQVLAPSRGLYHYRYVLSTERYSSQPVEQVSLTMNLHVSSGLSSVYSSSHPVHTERLGADRARVTWEAEYARPTEDFELFFAPAEGGFGAGLLTGRREDQDHFLFIFSPEAESENTNVLPKDIVFVIDRSGSMGGEKIQQARDALHYILGLLNPNDRFSIVGFDHRLSLLSPTLQPVEKGALEDARRFVNRLQADGNTDLETALRAGLEILAQSEAGRRSSVIVFLTDGLPTAGIIDQATIGRLVTQANARLEARLHVFGVGYDVNTHLLDGLAADNGGTVTYVQPGENLEAVLTGFYERIAYPVLTDIEIEFEGLDASARYPEVLPDLFQGSSLMLTGRYQAKAPTVVVRVRGRAGVEDQEYVYRFDLPQDGDQGRIGTDHDFVPRLWATRRLGELLDRVRVEGEHLALVDEIRELGLAYGLVTPFTTYVIEAQLDGAASAANMALYANQTQLNQAWGQTTIQARVQNQQYQQADQANLATGANVIHNGQRSLAQVGYQHVDLTLLQNTLPAPGWWQDTLDSPITQEWLAGNIPVDRIVAFGSDEYFALADDPIARPYLQSGPNVVFAYQGQVISVEDGQVQSSSAPDAARPVIAQPAPSAVGGIVDQAYTLLRDLAYWLLQAFGTWIGS